MSETLLQKHWYDGLFYALFIDSDLSPIRERMHPLIEDDRRIIDIGCGTGGFALKLAQRSREVVGIDISKKQILQARRRLKKSGLTNVRFEHQDATRVTGIAGAPFDYALMTFIIHEIDQEKRLLLLKQAATLAKKIIILDYHVPLASNFWGMAIRLIEYFTSREHYSNFLDFRARGGLIPLTAEAGLVLQKQRINRQKIFNTSVFQAA